MRNICYFVIVIGMLLALGESDGTSAYAKTVEVGDSSATWNGSGEIQDLGNGDKVINGMVKGAMIARHKGETKTVVHLSKLVCPVRVTQNREKDYQAIDALCTIVAHEGKDVGYAQWKCVGTLKECNGEFTMTSGTGGFGGISGTTPFKTSIIFEVQEGKNAQAIGYAQWPNMTYTLP